MPSQKHRSKEDTWTTDELGSALNADRERQRQERREKREKRTEKVSRDDSKHRKSVPREDVRKTRSRDIDEDVRKEKSGRDDKDREREREERRKKREAGTDRTKKDDSGRRERREKVDVESKRHAEGGEKENRISSKNRSKQDEERKQRRKYKNDIDVDNEDIQRKDKERRRRHEDNNETEKDRRRKERHENQEERKDRKERRHKYEDDEDEREKRRRERRELREARESRPAKIETPPLIKEDNHDDDNDYNYDDDFEDYEEDFEEDDDDSDKPKSMEDRELSDVLKALDEENARLVAESQRSPFVNSPESRDEEEEYIKSSTPSVQRGRTLINFTGAKQRAMDQKIASKTKKRGQDLLKLIEFDKAEFDMFDLPPVKEYDLYIRSFGRTDTKQAYVQTNEENLEREIQTDEIESEEKWTQIPADDIKGSGGNSEKLSELKSSVLTDNNLSGLNSFLSKITPVIDILIEEETNSDKSSSMGNQNSNLSISNGYSMLTLPTALQGRHVIYASFSPNQPNMLLTCLSLGEPDQDNPASSKGILCSWNITEPSFPKRILACESIPLCCCFSPSRPVLACAGMLDGSIAVWDLREQSWMHHSINFKGESILMCFPTYNTAGISDNSNHHSPVKSLVPVYSDPTSLHLKQDKKETETDLSFQLASMEEQALVNLWVVTEIQSSDISGSELDLGLSPGGKIKLVKSKTINLRNPIKTEKQQNLKAFQFHLSPSDLNSFYVGTDGGFIVHGVTFGASAFPRRHSPMIDNPVDVLSLEVSPFGYPYILSGCSDGSVQMYYSKMESPLTSWNNLSEKHQAPIQEVKWSRSRAGVFFVLDQNNKLFTFDLLEGESRPVSEDQLKENVTCMLFNNDTAIIGSGSKKRCVNVLLAYQNGDIEIHYLKPFLLEQQTLESEYLRLYNERF